MVDIMNAAKWAIGFKGKSPDGPRAEVGEETTPGHKAIIAQQYAQFGNENPKRGEPIQATVYPLSPVKKPNPVKRLPVYLKPKKKCKTCPTFVKKKAPKKGEWK